jgi:hypothetical protein
VPGKLIPERNPVGDPFSGYVYQAANQQVLTLTPLTDAEPLASGDFVVRYGLRYLGKPHLSVVPGLVALDYGDFLTGEEAWEFLLKGSNLYPRSEVIGYRNDGQDEMIVIKALDLSLAPEVLIYADAKATAPIAKPVGLIAPAGSESPPRLLKFLPRFDSFAEWQSTL